MPKIGGGLFRRKPKHKHDWQYYARGLTGWGIVECKTCGETELY